MDLPSLSDFKAVVLPLIPTGLLAWVGWSLRKGFASRDDLGREAKARDLGDDKLTQALAALGQRMGRVEAVLETMPSANEVHALGIGITEAKGEIATLRARIESLTELLQSISAPLQLLLTHELGKVKS